MNNLNSDDLDTEAKDLVGHLQTLSFQVVLIPYFLATSWFMSNQLSWVCVPLALVLVVWLSHFSVVADATRQLLARSKSSPDDGSSETGSPKPMSEGKRVTNPLVMFNLTMVVVAEFALIMKKSDFWFAVAGCIIFVSYLLCLFVLTKLSDNKSVDATR